MISYRIGNLLDQPDIEAIVHQANIYHTFGAGIARAIRDTFPYAFAADKEFAPSGDEDKLGDFSVGSAWDSGVPVGFNPLVINLYSQVGLSPSHTSYDYMVEALSHLVQFLTLMDIRKVGFPYQMGCGLADGNWEIVKVIIEQAFKDSDIEVVIVKLPEA